MSKKAIKDVSVVVRPSLSMPMDTKSECLSLILENIIKRYIERHNKLFPWSAFIPKLYSKIGKIFFIMQYLGLPIFSFLEFC